MSYVEKYKNKFNAKQEEIKTEDPKPLNLTKEQVYQFECAVREEIKSLGQRCLERVYAK